MDMLYKDAAQPSDARARDLLSRMTVDEKIDQMVFFDKIETVYDDIKAGREVPCRAGMWGDLNNTHREDVINTVQDYFLNKTRLGIPALIGFEALHGLFFNRATVFPQNAGIGGSFDLALYREMCEIIGKECRAAGIRQVYAPVLDIPHDPRWGRSQEAYGEDPYLVAEMGATYVKEVQKSGIAATAKHFVAYGAPENGLNCAPAHIGEREVREVFLEPFKKCVDAGVHSLMPSYNEVDGEPCHSSIKYLREILRDEWGFEGVTIADWGGVNKLQYWHAVAEDALASGKLSLAAGLDIEEPRPFGYGDEFRAAVKSGEIDIGAIDAAVYRILKMKFDIGLFEDPKADPTYGGMHTERAVRVARELDERSILLIKNDSLLPLDEHTVGTVAVIGNNAENSFIGDYIGRTRHCVGFLEGIRRRLGDDRVLYARGCRNITTTDEMIAEAVETAERADLVMLVLGDASPSGGGDLGLGADVLGEYTSGEGYDACDLGLSPSQKRLFDAVTALGKPTLLIYYAGRPCAIKYAVDRVEGCMLSFGGGEQSGIAFANLIFGDRSPSARLSFSLPLSVGSIPCYYNHKGPRRGLYGAPGTEENPGHDYVLSSPEPWLPFGYGLSYTSVAYSDLCAELQPGGEVRVRVRVENTGSYAIDESVLLFVKMLYCPITPPIKKLRKFQKVSLLPGEARDVEFILSDEDFTYIDYHMQTKRNTGKHKILVGDLTCTIELK